MVLRAGLAWLREVCVQLTAAVKDGVRTRMLGRLVDLRHARELYAAQLCYGQRAGLEAGVAEVAMALGTVAVLALSALLLVKGQISFAAYPPAIVLAIYAFIPLAEVSVPLRMLGQIRAAAIRDYDELVRAGGTFARLIAAQRHGSLER